MDVAHRYLDALARRDFEALAGCFAPDARMRVLTPHLLRELDGPIDIAARFRAWFEGLEHFELLDSDAILVADRVRIRWHTRGEDPVKGWQENEHTGYAEIAGDRIVALNIACAGFRPTAAPGS